MIDLRERWYLTRTGTRRHAWIAGEATSLCGLDRSRKSTKCVDPRVARRPTCIICAGRAEQVREVAGWTDDERSEAPLGAKLLDMVSRVVRRAKSSRRNGKRVRKEAA